VIGIRYGLQILGIPHGPRYLPADNGPWGGRHRGCMSCENPRYVRLRIGIGWFHKIERRRLGGALWRDAEGWRGVEGDHAQRGASALVLGAGPCVRRPRNRNQTPQLLFSILVDMRRDGATITVTCGHKLKASDTTIPVSLGELSKHRPCWRSFRGSGLFTGCERQWIECHALCCWCT